MLTVQDRNNLTHPASDQPNLGQDFWDNRWQKGETGWDLGEHSPVIGDFVETISDKDFRILIPGCGNAYEAEYLLNKGFTDITVLDIAPTAAQALSEKFNKGSL